MGGTASSTIKALREGSLDFAVGSAAAFAQEPDLRKERLLTSEMTIIARCGHPLSGARLLGELRDAVWVINAAVSDPDPATVVMFRRNGLQLPTRAIYCDFVQRGANARDANGHACGCNALLSGTLYQGEVAGHRGTGSAAGFDRPMSFHAGRQSTDSPGENSGRRVS